MATKLLLGPEPVAAKRARRWVREQLLQRSRPELLESAVLGVSELVTNAIVHVKDSMTVQIVDDDGTLRIEVHDQTSHWLGRNDATMSRATNPATVGHGIRILAAISEVWGVRYHRDGKCTWFQPKTDVDVGGDVDGFPWPPSAVPPGPTESTETLAVTLVDVPVVLVNHYRSRYRELRRELTLIALGAGRQQATPPRLAMLAGKFGDYRASLESGPVAEAVTHGLDRATTTFHVSRTALPDIRRLQSLVAESDEFCDARQLLTLPAGPQEKTMRAWFLQEVLGQSVGADPTPWDGDFAVTDPDPLPRPTRDLEAASPASSG